MQVNRFDLNLLRALDALLSERNVTRAAERLFVTQQAMSGTLQRLRDHFDDQLLVRVGRQLELTPLAISLVVPVRESLLKIQMALETRPTFDPSASHRTCRIAMSDYTSFVLLPRFLRKLAGEAPHIRCLVEGVSEESFERVERGDLDFVVSASDWSLYANYRPGKGIRSNSVFHDDFVCAVASDHPEVGDQMTLDLYRALPHNLVLLGRGVTTIIEQGWRQQGLDLTIAATAPSFSTLLFMLPGTPLVATAQRRLARALAPTLGLRVLECPVPLPTLQENLTWHQRNELDPGHSYLRNTLMEAAVELDGEEDVDHNLN